MYVKFRRRNGRGLPVLGQLTDNPKVVMTRCKSNEANLGIQGLVYSPSTREFVSFLDLRIASELNWLRGRFYDTWHIDGEIAHVNHNKLGGAFRFYPLFHIFHIFIVFQTVGLLVHQDCYTARTQIA